MARIPGATVGDKAGTLQYMVEAVGQGEMTLAHAGTDDEPKTVTLTESTKGKGKWAWWVLGIGGGLAVVGGVTLLRSRRGAPPELPGRPTPPVTAAS